MTPNLEKFRPKLKAGRVIPKGSRIVFEMNDPYNQIELPMVLADFVLLCSGQFTVREILEKIYYKQGSVPFKSILKAVHLLHQGGFFENGDELILSRHLQSWMEPRKNAWRWSWRFGQKIVAAKSSTSIFYGLTLVVLIGSIFGLQYFPLSPVDLLMSWGASKSPGKMIVQLLLWGSVLQTVRYALCGAELLLLTAHVYNVSLRLSPWGLHLHVGDEANDLFQNRLYTSMFHVSQIFVSWLVVLAAGFVYPIQDLSALVLLAMVHSFWEINPFRNSEGKKLFRNLLIPSDREVSTWHFDSDAVVNSLTPEDLSRDQSFARLASSWGLFWLAGTFVSLSHLAITFGPSIILGVFSSTTEFWAYLTGLVGWFAALYYVVQNLMQIILLSVFNPILHKIRAYSGQLSLRSAANWQGAKLKSALDELPLFSHFDEYFVEKIIAQSKVMSFSQGEVIFDQGTPAQDLFVLLDGEVEVLRKTESGGLFDSQAFLNKGSVFGEAALVDDAPRAARVCASSYVTVLKTPVVAIRQVAMESKSVRQLDVFRNAIMLNQYFVSSPAFRSLSPASVQFLCSRGSLEFFDARQTVFNQGDEGGSLYLIIRGQMQVFVHGKLVKTLMQGSFFGEISLIADIPRTATMVTSQPSVLFKISAEAFWEILVENMDLGVFIETISENRLREDLMLTVPSSKTGTES